MPSDPPHSPPSDTPVYQSVRRGPSFQGELNATTTSAPTLASKRQASRSFYWTMLVALVGAAALAIWIGPGLIEPERRVVTQPTTPIASPVRTVDAPPNPLLASAYGEGTIRQAAREARRIGKAGIQAVTCELKPHRWGTELRAAMSADITERYPSFDDTDQRSRALLSQFALNQFDIGQREGEQDLAQRGQQQVCAELPTLPDYRAADRLARDVAARRR